LHSKSNLRGGGEKKRCLRGGGALRRGRLERLKGSRKGETAQT